MGQTRCPHCGNHHPSGARFCQVTGQTIPENVSCSNCGTRIERYWEVCASCGHLLTPQVHRFPKSVDVKQYIFVALSGKLWLFACLVFIALVITIGYGLLSGWGDNHPAIAQLISLREIDNDRAVMTLDRNATEATSVILADQTDLAAAITVMPKITVDQILSATLPPVRSSLVAETTTPTVEITEKPKIEVIPVEIVEQMNFIQEQVSELRGLSPQDPISHQLLSREELRQRVIDDFKQCNSKKEAEDKVIVHAVFGLLDPEFDLYSFHLDLSTEQISGFYDTETKEMYVLLNNGFTGIQKINYAHEIVHALQNQHFDIIEGFGYKNKPCEGISESCTSIRALMEGDASLLELQWFSVYADQQDFDDMQEYFRDYESSVFDSAPPYIQMNLLFPFIQGQAFVDYFYQNGGWGAVDLIYQNPPVSTEQILYPNRYPHIKPVPVELPDLSSVLPANWREVNRGVLGEWYTYLVLAHGIEPHTRLDESQARDAADGWAGDTYAVYTNDRTNQTIMVLVSEWKNETEAVEFSNAFHQYAELRFGMPTYTQTGTTIWDTSAGCIQFRSKNEKTTWILAPDRNLGELIWSVLE